MEPDLLSQIIKMYVDQNFSPQQIFEKLTKTNVKLSIGKIVYALRKAKVIRKRSIDRMRKNYFREKTCVLCANNFIPKGTSDKYCKTCVPTQAACMRVNNFGISQSEYDHMIAEQNNSCGLCQKSFSELKNLQIYVDHCHRSENVRGVICARCNTFLMVLDAPDFDSWFKKAKQYITKPGIVPIWKRNDS